MRMHLPLVLRGALLAVLMIPAQAALTWEAGNWNMTDSSWLEDGAPAVFRDGEAVEFTADGGRIVNITEIVSPGSVQIVAPGYEFGGVGGIGGDGVLVVQDGATLEVQNANAYTGGSVVESGAVLTLRRFDSVGNPNASEFELGAVSGAGTVLIDLASADSQASIQGSSWQTMNGVLKVQQGQVGLGRNPGHAGAGQSATLGAARVDVGAEGSFILSLGGGQRSLVTNNYFTSNVSTESGATLGNRDGHVNWSGAVQLNVQQTGTDAAEYNESGSTEMNMYYAKFVVWDGVVTGAGELELTSGVPDTGGDHRLILTNGSNAFSGTYRVNGAYLTTLALAAPGVASAAGVQLDTASSRLMLMDSNAEIATLNGSAGTVLAEGNGNLVLTVGGGSFSGTVQDAAGATAGLSLGLTKVGSGDLSLSGPGSTYTGTTTVQGGNLSFSGDASLGDVSVAGGALLRVSGSLRLRNGASLQLEAGDGAGVQVEGALELTDTEYGVEVSGYEELAIGNYELMTWGGNSSVGSTSFYATGLSDTTTLAYSVRVQGNSLQLVVSSMDDVPWLWSGGSAAWLDDSTTAWQNSSGSGPAGQQVTFGPRNAGVVTIDRVTPAGIRVTGGEYTFTGVSAAAAGIVSSGLLSVSGENTVLNMNLANPSFSGSTSLPGGTLVLGAENALGASSIYFNGGLLRYGTGVTQDISAQIHADSSAHVRIDTNGNSVTWADTDGVKQTLSQGVEKNGSGEWLLQWAGSNDTHQGDIVVNEGGLGISKLTGQGTLTGSFSGTGIIRLASPNGQLNVLGDNSGFSGTLVLSGNGSANTGSVRFADGDSIGGSGALVQLAGLRFWFESNTSIIAADIEIMDGTSTYMDGRGVAAYTFTGSISGGGSLLLKPTSGITMSGDISRFNGSFSHPGASEAMWLLGGAGVTGGGQVQADLSAAGSRMTYTFQYSSPIVMSGVVSGAANLRQSGSGVLTLTGQSTSSGVLSIDAGSEIRLGSADAAGSWAGETQQGDGLFTLVNGTLTNGLTSVEGTLVADVAAGATVNMGGMDANILQGISIGTGGLLSGITGDLRIGTPDGVPTLSLTPGARNVGASAVPGAGEAVMLNIEGGKLVVHESAAVELDMESIRTILQGQRQAVYLHLSNAEIDLQNGIGAADLFANSTTTPAALGLVVLGVQGGNIVLEGDVRDVYMVMQNGDYPIVTDYTRLQDYKATYVDEGYTLSLNLPGNNTQEAWVNNLLGSGNFSVTNTDESGGVVRVLLNNTPLGQVDSTLPPDQENEIESANTLFLGDLSAGTAVQLVKTGSGTLTAAGVLRTDWLEVDEGTLRLTGRGSEIRSLHGDGKLVSDGKLTISGNSLAFTGELSGSGELVLDGSLSGSGSVGALSGQGELRSAGDVFTVQNTVDSVFSGALTTGDSEGVLSVLRGSGAFTMNQVRSSSGWILQNRGELVLQQAGQSENAPLTLGGLHLESGSSTTIVLNTDAPIQVFSLGSLLVQDGAAVTLQSTGQLPLEVPESGEVVLGQVGSADLGADAQVPLTLGSGAAFRGIESAWLSVENGQLLLNARQDTANKYAAAAVSANGRAGAQLLWNLPTAVLRKSPDLLSLTQALNTLVAAGDASMADRAMAAAAGAGAAVLAGAMAGDMERQLRTIRNRTTVMGVNPAMEHDFPLFNAWVNAEGDRRELKADGTESGYSLSSRGATVGFDADLSTQFTAGVAFTAMYGDFQGKSADHATGDADNYYLTLFGRYTASRWTHTLVGAFGWIEVELRRRVDAGSAAYSTHGSTEGTGVGLLYELGYVIPLDEDNNACLQPIANISYRHIALDAYSEQGSDAALHIGKQDMDVLTFGLGARAQAYALENMANRSCLLEARALLKIDAGDTRSHTTTALLADRSRSARVRSAATDRFGVEFGAGISVPLGAESGSLFLDAGVELRHDESAVNGTVGYRLSF